MQLDLQGHPAEEANSTVGLEMDGEERLILASLKRHPNSERERAQALAAACYEQP